MQVMTVAKIPSVNHYVRHAKGKHFKSKEVIEFEKSITHQLSAANKEMPEDFKGLRITFVLRKDFGRRDLDNMPKVFIDCLAKFYRFNDSKISKLVLEKKLDKTLNYEFIWWEILK